MLTITRRFAEDIAEVSRLLREDEEADEPLRRLTRLGVELVPGAQAAAVTIARDGGPSLTFAASDPRLDRLHDLQFGHGVGPVVETLLHNEPRRVDDTGTERRWPKFCRAAAQAGFSTCLALPLRTDRRPAGAVVLYGTEPGAFQGVAHDIALLFAAQGGTALSNAALYRACGQMVANLHTALRSRAVIEQAKGIVHAKLAVSPEKAFELLSHYSQNHNRKLRKVAADLLEGRIASDDLRPTE